MKIAMVTPEFPPDSIGGGGVVFESLVREYASTDVVRIFTAADSSRSWTRHRFYEPTQYGMTHRYPLIPVGKRIPYLRSAMPPNPVAWNDLRADLLHWQPDVAHVHGYGHAFIDLASRILARHSMPYVFTSHGIPTRPIRRGVSIRAGFKAYQRLGPAPAIRAASFVTAVSKSAAATLNHRQPIRIIPNGVSRRPPRDPSTAPGIRATFDLPNNLPLLVGVGRLSIEKGFDVLIRALDLVTSPELVCVIAGSDGGAGFDLADLAARARPGVSTRFPGRLTEERVADLMSIADVVVVPSREESFGLVALEALASGRRLVASRAGGLTDFLHPGIAELVERDNPVALAKAITDSLSRGPLTPTEKVEGEALVDRYSWKSVASQYQIVLREAMGR